MLTVRYHLTMIAAMLALTGVVYLTASVRGGSIHDAAWGADCYTLTHGGAIQTETIPMHIPC